MIHNRYGNESSTLYRSAGDGGAAEEQYGMYVGQGVDNVRDSVEYMWVRVWIMNRDLSEQNRVIEHSTISNTFHGIDSFV